MKHTEDEIIDNLVIPDTVVVALREDLYASNGIGGFVSYHKGKKLLHEKDFINFKDNNREPIEIENNPTGGFSIDLNDCWSNMISIIDPRGFQVTITTQNLVEILRYSEWSVDKGLVGKFLYSWNGNNLKLISTIDPSYKASNYVKTKSKTENISAKDLVPGVCYKTSTSREVWYIGRLKWRLLGRNKSIKIFDIHTFYFNERVYDDLTRCGVFGIKNISKNILISMPEKGKLDPIELQDIKTTFQTYHGAGIIASPTKIEILEPREKDIKTFEEFKKNGQWIGKGGWTERTITVGCKESDTVIRTYDLKKDASGNFVADSNTRYELKPDGTIDTQYAHYSSIKATGQIDLDKVTPLRIEEYKQCKIVFSGGQECMFDLWGRYLSSNPEVVLKEKEEDD